MRHPSSDPAQYINVAGVAALLLIIFASELAVMELLSQLFSRLSPVSGALLDAAIVVVLVAGPLWFFCARDFAPEETPPKVELAKALIGIFLAEYLVMLLLPGLLPSVRPGTRAIADALLTALACGFPLWWFLSRQALRRRSIPLMDTSLRLYLFLLCTIFLSDLLKELLWPASAAGAYLAHGNIVDAGLTTLFGAPLLWLLVVRPLKRSARAEQTRVAAIHAQLIDAIVVIDPQGVIRSFNPAAENFFGHGATEMIGNSAALLFDDGQKGLEALISSASLPPGKAQPPQCEISCRRRDGLTAIMGISISQVLLEQKTEFLLIMRDITSGKRMEKALRESEARFREIFDQSEDAIVFFKPGGCTILDVNENAERTFGYEKRELQDAGVSCICDSADLPALEQAISGIAEGGIAQSNFLCKGKDGVPMVVSLRGKVMLLQGVPITYCTFRDVTYRVRMEEKTRDIQAKLIHTNKMTSLGLLVSGVAHEINNPNNFIMANSELLARISHDSLKVLKEYGEDQEGGEFYIAGIPFSELLEHSRRLFDGIAEGSRRVNGIVTNLKSFARQERRQQMREVDVNEVAHSAVTLLHHELIKYTSNFHLQLAQGVPPVKGHGQQLGQVIINLLMNACQALPDKQCAISLSTGYDAGEGVVSICVSDEGCGMSREDSQRIMEPFFTTRLDDGGTGLGLSISESIVKEHAGLLEFSSEPGRGTTFTVKMPAAEALPSQGPVPKASAAAGSDPSGAGAGYCKRSRS